MRLNKYIAQAGLASRREADRLTSEGKVTVNGAVCTELGYDVKDDDVVAVNGSVITASEKLVYYALNKPVGFITTVSDEQGRPTVMDLMTDVTARVYPVGRLDGNTSGLLILTNDGKLAYHIAHPSQKVWKRYLALVTGQLSMGELNVLRNGVDIGGYKTKPAKAEVVKMIGKNTLLQIEISEGKNHQVRKMCKAVGHPVLELQRTAIGQVQLGHLHEGSYRKLTPREIEYLRKC